eukprot:scaffold16242_cov55-Attheya_sp.AAC.13
MNHEQTHNSPSADGATAVLPMAPHTREAPMRRFGLALETANISFTPVWARGGFWKPPRLTIRLRNSLMEDNHDDHNDAGFGTRSLSCRYRGSVSQEKNHHLTSSILHRRMAETRI